MVSGELYSCPIGHFQVRVQLRGVTSQLARLADDMILAQLSSREEQWVVIGCSLGWTLTFTPLLKAHCPYV